MHFHRLLGAALAALFFWGVTPAHAANDGPLTPKRGTITTQNLVAGGACTAGGCVEIDVLSAGALTVQVTGTYTASGGLSAQATTDGVNWVTLCSSTCSTTFTRATTGATSAAIASGVQDVFQVPVAGYRRVRITALGAVTGTATIAIQPTEKVPSGFASITGGGDASAANQVTGNTSLGTIDAGIPAALGAAAMAAAMPVTIATDDARIGIVTETAPASDTASSGLNGRLQRIAQNLTTLNTSVNTAPNYEATKDAAVPTRVLAIGARIGANEDAVAQGATTVAINVSTATTTQLVALSGTTKIYVTGLAVIAGGTGNITLVYGTGSSCGTGTTSLSGAIPLVANAGFTLGSGLGAVLMVPAGQALCITTSAAVQMSGFVTYAQF
jgi:hypothetical protein